MNKKNPYVDVIKANCHDFVEIGGVKWATMNVGATGITDYGFYFAFGETVGYSADQVGRDEGKKFFGWADYKYGNGAPLEYNMGKYNRIDDKMVLDLEDDAAHVNWGGGWRMPTTDEYVVLGKAATTAWTMNYQGSGVSGFVLTDKNDLSKVLFFPAAGYCINGCVLLVGSNGLYWSSSLKTSDVVNGYRLFFNTNYVNWRSYSNRYNGFTVRGVLDC